MKFLLKTLTVTIILFLTACSGSRGPTGPQGPEGPPGPEILPISFEFTVDLLTSNNFEFISEIPGEIEVFDSDVVIAFVLEDFLEDEQVEVWRQLPITEFNQRGTLLFDFDFTFADVRIFLDANYSLGMADEFEGVLIRAVHIPADFLAQNKAKLSEENLTFTELENLLGVEIKPAFVN